MSTIPFSDTSEPVLCCYINKTKRIQVGKSDHRAGWNLERVIFPDERFLFEAPSAAQLEIYIELAGKTTLLDRISCSQLQTKTVSEKTLELVH